jgi:hypothetical protein
MGWLSRSVNKWASDKQFEELASFIANLRAMDGPEIGYVLAIATHIRHGMEGDGHNVMDPIVYTSQNPSFALYLSRMIIEAQKQGRNPEAAALMIWLHTMRAGIRIELRSLARELWSQLERGFPYVEQALVAGLPIAATHPNVTGASQFPAGFTPTPL